jgi:hypothetical protein
MLFSQRFHGLYHHCLGYFCTTLGLCTRAAVGSQAMATLTRRLIYGQGCCSALGSFRACQACLRKNCAISFSSGAAGTKLKAGRGRARKSKMASKHPSVGR